MKTNELLRRYVDDRSEPAFEELVKQHIDLVYSSALRQVSGDVPAAQDVTQAVFTELARHAPRLTRHTSLAGWLYTSTRYLAAKALRAEQRRRSHEQEAHEMNQLLQSPDPDTTWQELRPLLDDAMHDLSDSDREAVLMRYFERLPLAEIGARLGLKENAAHMRIERAIDRLRAALAKRGVTSTITALALLLTGRAVASAPQELAARVSRAALATAAATGGLTWALLKLAGLLKGNALLTASAAVLVAGFIVVPKWLATATPAPASAASTPQKPAALTASTPGQAIANYTARVAAARTADKITLHIIADDTGKPVAGATIEYVAREIGRRTAPPLLTLTPMTATDQGVCEIPLSRDTMGLLWIESRTDGFVDTTFAWSPDRGERIPPQYALRLARSVPIGGQVVDEDGRPVAGAVVQVDYAFASSSENSSEPPHFSSLIQEKTVAGVDGRWRIDRFAKEEISRLRVVAKHPDCFTEPLITYNGGNTETDKQLLAGTLIYKLTRGIPVRGVVVDAEGHPVPGVKVAADAEIQRPALERLSLAPGQSVNIQRVDRVETTNLADGTFVLTGCRPGTNEFSAEARGFALASLKVTLTNDSASLRFVLQPGHVLRLRLLDANGLPATNCIVYPASLEPNRVPRRGPTGPRGGRGGVGNLLLLQPPRTFRADAEGRVVWESSPDPELQLDFQAAGNDLTNMLVPADGQEHLVTLASAGPTAPPHLAVKGNVREAATGQPIDHFLVHTGRFWPTHANFTPGWISNKGFQGGTFAYNETWGTGTKYSLRFKIEADGYAPFTTRDVGPDEGDVSLDIVLYPAPSTSVTVLSQDGQPVVHADVGLEMPYEPLAPLPGGLRHTYPGNYTNVLLTDERGRFVLPPDDSITRVVAACPDGYVEATPAALVAEPILRLQPWGRIEGSFFSAGQPAAGRVLALGFQKPWEPTMISATTAETDAGGRFVFPKVPPGEFILWRKEAQVANPHFHTPTNLSYGTYDQFRVPPVRVRAGETAAVSGVFYTVTAHLSLPAGVEMGTNWFLSAMAHQPQLPQDRSVSAFLREFTEGTWVAEDLPAGDYTLRASAYEQGTPTSDSPRIIPSIIHMQTDVPFTIPADPPSWVVDLGEIRLQPAP